MNNKICQEKINKALWKTCDSFRGVISADTYKDLVLAMLFLKYISDTWEDHYNRYKEEDNEDPEHLKAIMENDHFILPETASFNTLLEHSSKPGNGERIDRALRAIEKSNYNKLKVEGISVFQDISFNTDKLGEEKQKNDILEHLLNDFVNPELNLKLSWIGTIDVIGNATEFLIKNFAASSALKAGEYYTPPEVSDLIVELLDPQPGDSICDPTCGSGSLLLKCGRKIVADHSSNLYSLYGQETVASTWSMAKMNMFLHGETNYRIEWGDTLRNPKLLDQNGDLMTFNIVVANPPFSLDKWGYEDAVKDELKRFHRGIPPKTKGDYAFILHMIATLKPNTGRMGVIVPLGVLFRGSSEGRIRKQLIEENLLDAVIALPEKLFYSRTTSAALLIFSRDKSDDSVMFIDASQEFKASKKQNILTQENIEKIVNSYRDGSTIDKFSHVASLREIRDNNYNLNIPRYVSTLEKTEEIDLPALLTERKQLKDKLIKVEGDMAKHLVELGYNQ